ncbi:sporulation membrane protein YtrI [Priestia koreensis]|uniref:sporulation membrane protein YtrI n=1 Tax=Priestia koreensis TaxID=284581 RepID=UPI001F5A14B9|nr:sporulation membrane protein YtrI [Priestia koreensis]MCM3002790.1 DNA repair protein [Priestia koreensis]UNL84483.1 DNA repair protein [Priestia koreensis]
MRMPDANQYKSPGWQRFFAGLFIGALISWGVFLMIYGILQDQQIKTIVKQKNQIESLSQEIALWKNNIEELNKEKEHDLMVQAIKVKIINGERYKLDSYSSYLIQEGVKEEIEHLVSKDIYDVYKTKDLLKKAIENKNYEINKMKYTVEVHQVLFYTTLSIELKIKSAKNDM